MKRIAVVLVFVLLFSTGCFYKKNITTEVVKPADTINKEVTLYFGEAQAEFVVPEKRIINIKTNITDEELCKILVEQLIVGPKNSSLYKTIPPEAKIISLKVTGDLVSVDFSEEMYTKHWRGAAGESMTLSSLANTLTEIPTIKRVMPTINGKLMNIDVVLVEEPLTRMPEMIKK